LVPVAASQTRFTHGLWKAPTGDRPRIRWGSTFRLPNLSSGAHFHPSRWAPRSGAVARHQSRIFVTPAESVSIPSRGKILLCPRASFMVGYDCRGIPFPIVFVALLTGPDRPVRAASPKVRLRTSLQHRGGRTNTLEYRSPLSGGNLAGPLPSNAVQPNATCSANFPQALPPVLRARAVAPVASGIAACQSRSTPAPTPNLRSKPNFVHPGLYFQPIGNAREPRHPTPSNAVQPNATCSANFPPPLVQSPRQRPCRRRPARACGKLALLVRFLPMPARRLRLSNIGETKQTQFRTSRSLFSAYWKRPRTSPPHPKQRHATECNVFREFSAAPTPNLRSKPNSVHTSLIFKMLQKLARPPANRPNRKRMQRNATPFTSFAAPSASARPKNSD
jgi:hypothetical protein